MPSWVSKPAQRTLSKLSEGTTPQAKEYQRVVFRLAEIDTRLREEFGVDLKDTDKSTMIMNEVFIFQYMEDPDRKDYIMKNKFILPPGFMVFSEHCAKVEALGVQIKTNQRRRDNGEISLSDYARNRVSLYNRMTSLQLIQPVDICEFYKSVRVLQEERVHLLQVRRKLIYDAYRGGHAAPGTPPPAAGGLLAASGAAAGGTSASAGAAAGGTSASAGAAAGGLLAASGAAAGGTLVTSGAAAGGTLVTSGAAAGGLLAAARAAARKAPGAALESVAEESGEVSAESEAEEDIAERVDHLGSELFGTGKGKGSHTVLDDDLVKALEESENLDGLTAVLAREAGKVREAEVRAQKEKEDKERAEAEAKRLQEAERQAQRDMADAERERALQAEKERLALLEETAGKDAELREEELRMEREAAAAREEEEKVRLQNKQELERLDREERERQNMRKRALELLQDCDDEGKFLFFYTSFNFCGVTRPRADEEPVAKRGAGPRKAAAAGGAGGAGSAGKDSAAACAAGEDSAAAGAAAEDPAAAGKDSEGASEA